MVQLYVPGGIGEIRQLHGFEQVHLKAGETREVRFAVGESGKAKAQTSVGGGQPAGRTARGEGTI